MQEDGCTQREVPILNREVKDRMTKRVGCEQQTWRRGQWAMWLPRNPRGRVARTEVRNQMSVGEWAGADRAYK